jgi:peptide/nickel transport system substrate-binding protein
MTLAFDHEHLLRDVLQGIYRSGEGIYHPDSWMAAKDLKPFRRDIDEAESLLDEAGWTDRDGDGTREKTIDGRTVPFRFTLSCPAGGTGPKVAQLLWMNLREIGVDCEVKLVEWVAFNKDIAERRAQAFLMTMGTGLDPDLSSNQWTTKAQTTGRNYIGYSNPAVDALFEAGRREFAREKRAPIYAEIDRRIHADDPITILLYQPSLWCFSKSLRGFRPSPKGFYGYLPGFHALWRKKEAKP